MNKTIGVMGCGWLGRPLAHSFISDGYQVHGSTTSEEKIKPLQEEGIIPFLISFHEDKISGDSANFLKTTDLLVVNIPPKLRGGTKENYVKKMALLYREVKKSATKKIIFISSTSVYGAVDGEVNEATIPQPNTEAGKQLWEAEKIFSEDKSLQTTIIRFGGLIGLKRHPANMLSGREGLTNGDDFVNLIHLDDCIGIIKAVYENSWWNELLNGVYPDHPTKQDYYTQESIKRKIQPPIYTKVVAKKSKKINPKTLISVKNYRFITSI